MSLCTIHNYTIHLILQHVVYSFIIHRHQFLGSWTRGYIISQLIYWGFIMSCTSIEARTLTQTSSRAGILAIIHLIPLLFEAHLSFAADLMSLSLHIYWQLHDSMRIMILILAIFHVIITLSNRQWFFFQDDLQLYRFIVSSSESRWSKLLMMMLKRCLLDHTVYFLLFNFLMNVLQSFSENSSDSDFDCSLCTVTSSISQEAFCTHLCDNCYWPFDWNNDLRASTDPVLKLCSESHLCSNWCGSNQQYG